MSALLLMCHWVLATESAQMFPSPPRSLMGTALYLHMAGLQAPAHLPVLSVFELEQTGRGGCVRKEAHSLVMV